MSPEESFNKKNAAENFGKMLEAFGSAISEIFNDPNLRVRGT